MGRSDVGRFVVTEDYAENNVTGNYMSHLTQQGRNLIDSLSHGEDRNTEKVINKQVILPAKERAEIEVNLKQVFKVSVVPYKVVSEVNVSVVGANLKR